MKDFSVVKVSEFVDNFFEKVRLRDYNGSSIDAATLCFHEYEPIMNDGITEEIVFTLYIAYSMLKADKKIYIGQYNLISDAIEKALGGGEEIDLGVEEKEKILLLALQLKGQLPQMEITYDPRER